MTGLVWDPPLSPALLQALHDTIGLDNPDANDPLHVKLVQHMANAGQFATLGQRIVALRFVVNWAHVDAGARFADAKANDEKRLAERKMELALGDEKLTAAKIDIFAEADDELFALKADYLMAEQTERAMRMLLHSLDRAMENHRTDRADQRKSDELHAHGYTGGS